MYTLRGCPHCLRARLLLWRKGVAYRAIRSGELEHGRQTLAELTGGSTYPQIVIGEQCVGGAAELARLQRSGELDRLLAGGPGASVGDARASAA
jgi:glutaredoxin 3